METHPQVQKTPSDSWRTILRPFKLFILSAFFVPVLLASFGSEADTHSGMDWTRSVFTIITYGYVVSIALLILAGFVAAFASDDRRTFWQAVAYAGLGLVILGFLWPLSFPPLVK